MILFPQGINITRTEHLCLLYVEADPEQWLEDTITEKAYRRRSSLIGEWHQRLFDDPTITDLPADADMLAQLILVHPDYRSRVQMDAAGKPPEPVHTNNKDRYEAVTRRTDVVLFRGGVPISDTAAGCILAYVQDLEDWVLGALLGQINRGKKKMLTQYHPVLMADPAVLTFPASEDGLITAITARADYMTLPAQQDVTNE